MEMQGITTDAEGDEILVGLTFDETVFYMAFVRNSAEQHDGGARYLELHDKHERARLRGLDREPAPQQDHLLRG